MTHRVTFFYLNYLLIRTVVKHGCVILLREAQLLKSRGKDTRKKSSKTSMVAIEEVLLRKRKKKKNQSQDEVREDH